MDTAVSKFQEINLADTVAPYLMNGNPVQNPGNCQLADGELVRLTIGEEHKFVGIGSINDDGLLAPKRLIVLRDGVETT